MKQTFILTFTFFILNVLSINAQHSCGSVLDVNALETQNPSLYQQYLNQNQAIQNALNSPESLLMHEKVVIPVVVHVLHNGTPIGAGFNISNAQVESQIEVLNEDFRRLNANRINTPSAFANVAADANIEFKLACIDPNGNPTNGINRVPTTFTIFNYVKNIDNIIDEEATRIKFTSKGGVNAWNPNSYLNIWVCNLGSGDPSTILFGYAQFPHEFADKPNTDGIVVHYTAFGRVGSVTSPFNTGRVATHEVGHWLGLRHIWGDANCGNDEVNDTPVQRGPNSSCPTFPSSTCSNGSNGDMFMNYMDYTDNACMNMFTIGQRNRMRAVLFQGARENSNYMLFKAVLPNSLSARFLYGNDFKDLKSFTVGNGGILQVNGVGTSRFNNGVTLNGDEVTVKPNCGEMVDLNVEDGGQFVIGEGQRVGTVKTGNNNTITIKTGATLRIANSSKLVVESGSRLVINAGANINLVDLESKITIESGGQIIINGNFTYSGTGYFNLEVGNILTLNSDWILRGSGKTSRLIQLGHSAVMVINGGRRLTIEDALIRKTANIGNQDALVFNNGSTFFASNVTFDDQSSGGGAFAFVTVNEALDLDNSQTDMDYSFRNCAFNRSEIGVLLEGDAGGRFDFRNLNVEFINTTFTNCKTAYLAQHSYESTFEGCTILNGGIELQRNYWLQMRNTIMRGNRRTTGDNTTIGIKLSGSIHNWITNNSVISDYGTGIEAFTGSNGFNINGNIRLEQATIQLCETAVKQLGGNDFGLLYMDCTRILENNNGITGTDVLMAAHGRNNTANIYTRPNANPNSRFFDHIFSLRQETDLWLHGSYWAGQAPTTQSSPTSETINATWRFYRRDQQTNHLWPWAGQIFFDPVVDITNQNVVGCGGIVTSFVPNIPVLVSNAVVLVDGSFRDVRIQLNAAMEELEQNNLTQALQLFRPIAAIENPVRDNANSTVRYFVDVSRAMTLSDGVATSRSRSKGWLPQTLVAMPTKIENTALMVSPNPANNTVQVAIKNGNYHLRVLNAIGQTIFAQNTEGVLSVDVATWTNGIYYFELTDKATNKQQRSKIVVQH